MELLTILMSVNNLLTKPVYGGDYMLVCIHVVLNLGCVSATDNRLKAGCEEINLRGTYILLESSSSSSMPSCISKWKAMVILMNGEYERVNHCPPRA